MTFSTLEETFKATIFKQRFTIPAISKLIVLLTVIISNPVVIQAQMPSNLEYFTGHAFNDNWAGGFIPVLDDNRSFGAELDFQKQIFHERSSQFSLSWSGLTNRYIPDPRRLDEIKTTFRIPIVTQHSFNIDALAEGYFYGDFGGNAIQNKIHEYVLTAYVSTPYSTPTRNTVLFGAKFWKEIIKNKIGLVPSMEVLLGNHGSYRGNMNIGSFYRSNNADQISLSLGYNYFSSEINKEALGHILDSENGLYVQYKIRLGLFALQLKYYPHGNFSIGYQGLAFTKNSERTSTDKVNLTVEHGIYGNENGFYMRYLWNEITKYRDRFKFDLNYSFWSLPTYTTGYKGFYHQMSFGGNFTLFTLKPSWQLAPYVSMRLGFKEEKISGYKPIYPSQNCLSLNGIIEGGIRIKLPQGFIHENAHYGITINYHRLQTLVKQNIKTPVTRHVNGLSKGMFGFGAFVMLDL